MCHRKLAITKILLGLALLLAWVDFAAAATLPAGFTETPIGSGWTEVVGLTFAADGRMYAWERGGKVWIVENGVKSATPFIDISEEVGAWRDFGLLGFCLHPDFQHNGYVYLFYMVDHHYLKYFGTSSYSATTDEYFTATISRITRYTARASDGFRSVDPASRKILLGESITNGIPSLHQSHGPGSILFGRDGTLLVSCGDGASYSSMDDGGRLETYWQKALSEGIIRPAENVGSFRSQMVNSLNGKILRLDPDTGDGVSNNPFYDPAFPRSPRSRVWALGLRNPCRVNLRPGTGSTNRADANPGVLYIGDVGWRDWEELNVCTGPGQNFGWPLFEGLEVQPDYYSATTVNQDAPNPLYNVGGCAQQYFYFRDLIQQESLNTVSWPNPCNSTQQIPANIPHFVHRRPAIDWKHTTGPARTGIFSGSNADVIEIGASGSPVSGTPYPGNCSIGGVWYSNTDFPLPYRNVYFHADYGEQWIKMFSFDANNKPVSAQDFAGGAGGLVFVTSDPVNGGLYYIPWTSGIMQVRYPQAGNLPPTALASSDKLYGPSPLAVQFNSSGSVDPEGLALAYNWSFGDGTTASTLANPSHTFNAPAGVPTLYTVTLIVSDPGGLKATNTVRISVNNTPPQAVITSPVDGSLYPMTGDTIYDCTAILSDAEQAINQLTCTWQTFLHHNDHEHEEPAVNACATTTVLSPVGCDGNVYYYRVVLKVSDPHGLTTTREVRLYPDCPPPPSAPLHLLATAVNSGQIDLVWEAQSDTQTGYRLERSTNGTTFGPLASRDAATALYSDTGLSPGGTYFYRVAATNFQGSSPFSDVASATTPLFSGAHINFQPAAAPIPDGYEKDDGAVFGLRTNGLTYGWDLVNSANTQDRNSANSPDQRYDTCALTQVAGGGSIWEIAVPNGTYQVFLVAGDPTRNNSTYRYDVEGLLSLSGTPTPSQRWIAGSNTVTVTDGRLTVSNGAGASNNKICFIDISAPLDALNNPPTAALTSPANGASFNAPANITLAATANDTDGTVAKVEFFEGANKLGEDTTSPYSFAWNGVAAGSYTLTVKATDDRGATTISGAITLSVTNSAPLPVLLFDPRWVGSDFVFSFSAQSDRTYEVQQTDGLGSGTWDLIGTLRGDGTSLNVTNKNASGSQHFYRVQSK
jgi:glucose/arabinose dehydrogenase/PKD repeat protein